MKSLVYLCTTLLGLSSVFFPEPLVAAIPIPGDLMPGDSYRLIFVSSAGRDATSTDISEYDSFVQGLANAAGIGISEGVTWQIVGSTDMVSAIDHVGVFEDPVYKMNVGEDRVANDSMDLFDGSLANFINRDENNNLLNSATPWTGSTGLGDKALGNRVLGSVDSVARAGIASGLDASWLSQSDIATTAIHPFYSLSSRLTVPVVPEPTTLLLATVGCLSPILCRRHLVRKSLAR